MPLFKCSSGKATPKKVIAYITDKNKAELVSVRNLFEDEDYARQFTDDQFHINDTVSIQITSYSSDREWLRGKIRGKIG